GRLWQRGGGRGRRPLRGRGSKQLPVDLAALIGGGLTHPQLGRLRLRGGLRLRLRATRDRAGGRDRRGLGRWHAPDALFLRGGRAGGGVAGGGGAGAGAAGGAAGCCPAPGTEVVACWVPPAPALFSKLSFCSTCWA